MTVPAGATPIITYANTGLGDYEFSFRVFKETDLVFTYISTDGIREPLIIGSGNDYTVTLLNSGQDGGTCHLLVDQGSGGALEIRRAISQEQPTDWVNNDPLNANLLEIDFDRAIMIIQEMQAVIDGKYSSSRWRGDWASDTVYEVKDQVKAPDTGNIYVALTDHVSSTDFDTDLANGNWALIIDVAAVAAAQVAAELAADHALASEIAAKASEDAAKVSETNAAASESNAATSEANASASESSAAASSQFAQLKAWESEAERLTADSYATEPEDVVVKIYTSNGDGTFTATDTDPAEHSAYHWMLKAALAAGGGVVEISGEAPIEVDNTDPYYPIVKLTGDIGSVESVTGEVPIEVDNTDPKNPIVKYVEELIPPTGVYVTGNMYGLEYQKTGANTVSVDAGICYDSLNTTVLTLSTLASVSIPAGINTIYNLFLCDDGVVRVDTNVDGVNITQKKRWIGYVLTDSTSLITNFGMKGNLLNFRLGSDGGVVLVALSTAPTTVDHSYVIPITRAIALTYYAIAPPTNNYLITRLNAYSDPERVSTSVLPGDVHTANYGAMYAYDPGRLFYADDLVYMAISSILIRR